MRNAPAARVAEPTRLDWVFALSNQSPKEPPVDWLLGYDSTEQTYERYVPANYNRTKPAGLVLFISPGNAAAGRGFRSGGRCYTIPEIMSPEGQVSAMVSHYEHCWRRGGGNVAAAYVCYAGTIAPDNPIIVARVNDYNRCRAAGG